MEKTIHSIQVLAKIGRVLSKIVFICCLVGTGLCIAGYAFFAAQLPQSIDLGFLQILGPIQMDSDVTRTVFLLFIISVIVILAGEAVLSKFAEVYFRHELSAGTPFTLEGAKELWRLGILSIVIPAGTDLIASILSQILTARLAEDPSGLFEVKLELSLGYGIAFLLVSLLCKLGAQQAQLPPAQPTQKQSADPEF